MLRFLFWKFSNLRSLTILFFLLSLPFLSHRKEIEKTHHKTDGWNNDLSLSSLSLSISLSSPIGEGEEEGMMGGGVGGFDWEGGVKDEWKRVYTSSCQQVFLMFYKYILT